MAELAKNLDHQLEHASIRESAYECLIGTHRNDFGRKDYIAFALFMRCLQAHEAAETLVRKSLVDDAWVIVRSQVEYSVNCAYMLQVADATAADDFADFLDYQSYRELLDLKATNEDLLRQIVPAEREEELRKSYERVRGRFDVRSGDKWCKDDRLYRRAARIDDVISQAKKER